MYSEKHSDADFGVCYEREHIIKTEYIVWKVTLPLVSISGALTEPQYLALQQVSVRSKAVLTRDHFGGRCASSGFTNIPE